MTEPDFDAWARETPDTPAGRGASVLAAALNDLTADAIEGCAIEQVILIGTYTDGRSGYRGNLQCAIAPDELAALLVESRRQIDAFEQLVMRIHRDFNFDAGECAPPEGEAALRMMDDLVRYTEELSLKLETGEAL